MRGIDNLTVPLGGRPCMGCLDPLAQHDGLNINRQITQSGVPFDRLMLLLPRANRSSEAHASNAVQWFQD